MSASCPICSHPARKQIDEALLGKTKRQEVADRFSLTPRILRRHITNHLREPISAKSLKAWERRPGEKPRQWNAFELYLKLSTEHQERDVSFAEVARALGRGTETVRSWAFRYRWNERVEAWLSEIARTRLKKLRGGGKGT